MSGVKGFELWQLETTWGQGQAPWPMLHMLADNKSRQPLPLLDASCEGWAPQGPHFRQAEEQLQHHSWLWHAQRCQHQLAAASALITSCERAGFWRIPDHDGK